MAAATAGQRVSVLDLIPTARPYRAALVPAPPHGAVLPLSVGDLRRFCCSTASALAALAPSLWAGGHSHGHGRVAGVFQSNGVAAAAALFAFPPCTAYAPLSPTLPTPELQARLRALGPPQVVVFEEAVVATRPELVAAACSTAGVGVVLMARTDGMATPFSLEVHWHHHAAAATPTTAAATTPTAATTATTATTTASLVPPGWPQGGDAVALVLQTSGTTSGRPKNVLLSHAGLVAGVHSVRDTLRLRPSSDCGLNVMPLFHLHGIAVGVYAAVASLTPVVCPATAPLAPRRFFALAHAHGVTWYTAVPTIHLKLVEHVEQQRGSVEPGPATAAANPHPLRLRLVRNCSAALPVALAQRLRRELGCEVLTTYAMTECLPICSFRPCADWHLEGSVGPAASPTAVRVVDPATREECAPRVAGLVQVRGPCLMAGYEMVVDKAGGSASPHPALPGGGWLDTGDKGWLHPVGGALTLVGRYKELINRGGEKISPLRIEDAVLRLGRVRQCCAFAAPHRELGECVALAIVSPLLSDEEGLPSLLDLRQALALELEVAALPSCLVHVVGGALPTGPTGKPLRIGLAAHFGLPELATASFGSSWVFHADSSRLQRTAGGTTITPPHSGDNRRTHGGATRAAVEAAVLEAAGRVLSLAPGTMVGDQSLLAYGLDSILEMVLVQTLQERFPAVALPDDVFERCPDAASLAALVWAALSSAGGPTAESSRSGAAGATKKSGRHTASSAASKATAARAISLAREGDTAGLRALVDSASQHVDAMTDKFGTAVLSWAAGMGHAEAVTLLLGGECRADVNRGNREGRTALMWACRNGQLAVVQLLVARGADVRAVTKKGVTCLHWAVWGKSIATAQYLMDELGMDPETLSAAGCNCAIWAAASGSQPMCDFLLARSCNFLHLNAWGHGCVVKTAWRGHLGLLQYLCEREPGLLQQLFYVNPAGELPLDIATQAEHPQVVAWIRAEMARLGQPTVPSPTAGPALPHQHKARKMRELAGLSLKQRMAEM